MSDFARYLNEEELDQPDPSQDDPRNYPDFYQPTRAGMEQPGSLATSVSDAAAPTINSAKHECDERQVEADQVRAVPAAQTPRGIESATDLVAWSKIGRDNKA